MRVGAVRAFGRGVQDVSAELIAPAVAQVAACVICEGVQAPVWRPGRDAFSVWRSAAAAEGLQRQTTGSSRTLLRGQGDGFSSSRGQIAAHTEFGLMRRTPNARPQPKKR